MRYPGKPLHLGSRGREVLALQWQLKKYDRSIRPDADFGPQTARIVNNFVRNRRLGDTGEVDHVLWNRIFGYRPPKLHPRRPETLRDRLRRLRVELPVRQRQVKRGNPVRRRLNAVKRGIQKTALAIRNGQRPHVLGNVVTGGTPRERLLTAAYAALHNYEQNPNHWFYSQPGAWTVNYGITGPPRGYRSDCSQWVTSLYKSAGLKDPNGSSFTGGYTGTLANNGRHVALSDAKPGDLVIWDPYGPMGHVEMLTNSQAGTTIGHGSAPIKEHHISDFSYKGTPIIVSYL